jgi:hypothetical protein
MSWSVSAIGKPAAVAKKMAEEFAKNPCIQPEETIRQAVAGIVATALSSFPNNYAFRVDASGSQSSSDAGTTHSLSVKIEPIWGFCE